MAKLDASKLELEIISIEPKRFVEEIHSLILPQARDKGLRFNLNYTSQIPSSIKTDPLRLKQILINLCSNAIKFTSHGSVDINISSLKNGQEISFSIVDTGIGMTDMQTKNVFEAYNQGSISTTKIYGGTGLGLALSQRLTDMLGGSLTVSSTPDKGSTFTLKLDIESTLGIHVGSDHECLSDQSCKLRSVS